MEYLVTELILLVFGSMYCLGLHIATRYCVTPYEDNTLYRYDPTGSMIFGRFGLWVDENLPMWLGKMLINCLSCMASFHGSYIYITYWMVSGYPNWIILAYPVYILALCGLNSLIGKYFEL